MRQFIILTLNRTGSKVSIAIDRIESIADVKEEGNTLVFLIDHTNEENSWEVKESATEITKRINQIQNRYETEDI